MMFTKQLKQIRYIFNIEIKKIVTMRSVWKGPFIDNSVLNEMDQLQKLGKTKVPTCSRPKAAARPVESLLASIISGSGEGLRSPLPEDLEVVVRELDGLHHATVTEVAECLQDVLSVLSLIKTRGLEDIIQSKHLLSILADLGDCLPDLGSDFGSCLCLPSALDCPGGLGGELELALLSHADQTLSGQGEDLRPGDSTDVLGSGVDGGESQGGEWLGHG